MVQLRNKLAVALVVLQVVFVVLFALVVRYDDDANATQETHSRDPGNGGADPTGNSLNRYYASK